MTQEKLKLKRDDLLRKAKKEKSDYRNGYIDGVLDMYSEAFKETKEE